MLKLQLLFIQILQKNTLNVDGFSNGFEYQIMNNSGMVVLEGKAQNSIQLDQLESGIYFLNLLNSSTTSVVKIIVE